MDEATPKFISYQLYLLQLENYELTRYFSLLWKRGFFPNKKHPLRKELVWSVKAKALLAMAAALHILIVILSAKLFLFFGLSVGNAILGMISVGLILLPLYFLLFTLALLIIWPMDAYAKHRLVSLAQKKLSSMENLKIIGIAGSYGKTTMKEVLREVLGSKYRVLSTPDSVNTPVGVARWVLKNIDSSVDIAVVEMGEHYSGDVEELCNIAKPDIAVITGINEAHLERMKTLDNIVATVFEVVSASKPGAVIVLNADDKNVMGNYKKFVWPDHKVKEFRIENLELRIFDPERLVWKAKSLEIGEFNAKLLGEYALGDIDGAIQIGKLLGMSEEDIKKGITNIKPIEHRLQPILNQQNVLIIDDAYNGNSDGAAEAIKVLSRFPNRRKLFITPGLVESGKMAAEIHREIGRQLANVADVVILIRNSVTGFIANGIESSRRHSEELTSYHQGDEESQAESREILRPSDAFGTQDDAKERPQIIWFNTAQEAHASLGKILQPNDVIVFQNDWGDQYL